MINKGKKKDWLMIIPIIFLIVWSGFCIFKLYQTGNEVHIIDCIDVVNSNVFSTYISLVMGMAYLFFSADTKRKRVNSGLSPDFIAYTIILSVFYACVAIVNACRFCVFTTILMAIYSIVYVFAFYKYMRI